MVTYERAAVGVVALLCLGLLLVGVIWEQNQVTLDPRPVVSVWYMN